jgi:hypothetical protein
MELTGYLQKCLCDAEDKITVARGLCQKIEQTFNQTGDVLDEEPIKQVLNDAVCHLAGALLELKVIRTDPNKRGVWTDFAD